MYQEEAAWNKDVSIVALWVFLRHTWSFEVSISTPRLHVTIHTARTHASNWLHLSLGVTRLVRPTTSG